MAADSIAKLSIIITGDASPLTNELRKAEGNITGFSARLGLMRSTAPRFGGMNVLTGLGRDAAQANEQMALNMRRGADAADDAASSMFRFRQGTAIAAQTLTALRGGAIMPLIGSLGSTGVAGAAIAAGVALAALAAKSFLAADAARKSKEEFFAQVDALKAAGGDVAFAESIERVKSLSTAWGEARQALDGYMGQLAENTGSHDSAIGFLQAFTASFNTLRGLAMSPGQAIDAELFERGKAAAEREKKALEERARQLERMKSVADRIRESLRTPAEIFGDRMAELNALAKQGLVSVETMERASKEAKRELEEAIKKANEAKKHLSSPVSAAERGTAAGFSAVQQGQAQLRQQLEQQRQQTAIQQKIHAAIEEGNRIAKEKQPVVFARSNL